MCIRDRLDSLVDDLVEEGPLVEVTEDFDALGLDRPECRAPEQRHGKRRGFHRSDVGRITGPDGLAGLRLGPLHVLVVPGRDKRSEASVEVVERQAVGRFGLVFERAAGVGRHHAALLRGMLNPGWPGKNSALMTPTARSTYGLCSGVSFAVGSGCTSIRSSARDSVLPTKSAPWSKTRDFGRPYRAMA